jgi:pimeloyl-ACP methyl ester carboxylesterase
MYIIINPVKYLRSELQLLEKKLIVILVAFFLIAQIPTIKSMSVKKQKDGQPEIWIAFFHGLGGHPSVNVPLIENISRVFTQDNVTLRYINPQLPNDVSLEEWSNNIATEIEQWASNETQTQPWIILVGHSMGGKAGLHAVANNLKNIDKYVASVITINSPIKNLGRYRPFTYFWNGLLLHLVAERVLHTHNVAALKDCRDIDTSIDGTKWVSEQNRSWLSLISAEAYPTDPACDFNLTGKPQDMYPRYMDDGLVPIDAQYTTDSTTIYYGEYWHQAMVNNPCAIHTLANITVQYLTGGSVNVSFFHSAWLYDHKSILPRHWNETVGRDEILLDTGHISHAAGLLPPYQWNEEVGRNYSFPRSRFEVQQTSGIGSRVAKADWVSANINDYQLDITIQSLPLCKIDMDWRVYGIVAPFFHRDHYEMEVLEGSSYGHSGIRYGGWLNNNNTDLGICIDSWATFGTVKVGWSVFLKEPQSFENMSNLYHIK